MNMCRGWIADVEYGALRQDGWIKLVLVHKEQSALSTWCLMSAHLIRNYICHLKWD